MEPVEQRRARFEARWVSAAQRAAQARLRARELEQRRVELATGPIGPPEPTAAAAPDRPHRPA